MVFSLIALLREQVAADLFLPPGPWFRVHGHMFLIIALVANPNHATNRHTASLTVKVFLANPHFIPSFFAFHSFKAFLISQVQHKSFSLHGLISVQNLQQSVLSFTFCTPLFGFLLFSGIEGIGQRIVAGPRIPKHDRIQHLNTLVSLSNPLKN
jgi:hypothetical protein